MNSRSRHELLNRGWPVGALAVAVVKTSWGEGHLVLTVRTDGGDLVLDNLRPGIVPWERAGYRWIMRQSAENPQYWASPTPRRDRPPNGRRAADVIGNADGVRKRGAP